MTERAARNRASALGFCIFVVGACMLLSMGDSFSFSGVFGLIATTIVSIWKLFVIVIGMMLVFIGAVWFIRPHRALDTIDRNQNA